MSANGRSKTATQTRGSKEDQAFIKQQVEVLDKIAQHPTTAGVMQIPEIEEQVYDYYDRRYGAVVYSEAWHTGETLKAEWTATVDAALVKAADRAGHDEQSYTRYSESSAFNSAEKAAHRVTVSQASEARAALNSVIAQRQQRAVQPRRERQAAMQLQGEQQRATMRLEHQLQLERENAQRDHELALKDKELELERLRAERQDAERNRDREHELTLQRVRSELKRMELSTTQPFELQKNLSALILAAWEKQERDPTAQATFGNLNEIINQASTAVTRLTMDQDPEGHQLDDDSRRQKTAEALELVMRVADRLINRL